MFGRMMNNYYYGKSGKGDFRKEDLPQNRRQLFTDTLKTRLSALCRINLLYMLIFLPAMIVTMYFFTNLLSISSNLMLVEQNDYASYVEKMKERYGQLEEAEKKEMEDDFIFAGRDRFGNFRNGVDITDPRNFKRSWGGDGSDMMIGGTDSSPFVIDYGDAGGNGGLYDFSGSSW